jgi:hypothetical protein
MIILHTDNTKTQRLNMIVQKMSEFRMTSAPDPPDISASDFYLFGCLKDQLRKREYHNAEEFFRTVSEIRCRIRPEILLAVFVEWTRRFE